MTHFKGQEKGTNAITSVLNWDLNVCVKMYGTDGSYIIDSEFVTTVLLVYTRLAVPTTLVTQRPNGVLTTSPSKTTRSKKAENRTTYGLQEMLTQTTR